MALKALIYPRLPAFAQQWWARLDCSPLRARMARGAFWSLAGAGISRGLALLSSILVFWIVSQEGFGKLGIIQSTAGLFGVFAGFGLGLTSTKYVAEFREKNPAKAGRILALSAVVAWVTSGVAAAALFASAPWLAAHLVAPELTPALRISALLVLLGGVNGAQTGALSGFESFKAIAWVNLLTGLASFPLQIAGAWAWGVEGAVGGLAAGLALNVLLNHLVLRHESLKFGIHSAHPDWCNELPVLWQFSLPAILQAMVVMPTTWWCFVVLSRAPGGFAEMGAINVGRTWQNMILFLPTAFASASFPIMANLSGTASRQVRASIIGILAVNALLSLAMAIPVCLLSTTIASFYGPVFGNMQTIIWIMAVTAALMAPSHVCNHALNAWGRAWVGFALLVVWSVFVVTAASLQPALSGVRLATILLASQVLNLLTYGAVLSSRLKRVQAGATQP